MNEGKEHEILDLMKQMPRKELSRHARNNILNHLKTANLKTGIRNKRYRLIKRFVISICILVIIFSVPYIIKEVNITNIASFFSPDDHSHAWDISPKFDLLDKDKTIIYPNRLRGIEGKIGFLESGDFVANAREAGGKIFWYVWGDSKELQHAHLVATAVNRETGTTISLDDSNLQGSIYGADAHALTSFNPFPHKGLWRIDVTINNQPYGSIVVNVKDEYIQTKTTKLLVSKDDAVVGEINSTLVVPEHRDDQTIEVRMYSINKKNQVHTSLFQQVGKYSQVGIGPITTYSGLLQFDEPGQWQVEILGEKTIINVKRR
jgi:hypothetical protein